ncbi:MAG: conjugal transfer protein TraF [Marinobacter sp.]|nr:conjugal transfer protein TraF [Marinobacter sp.]
MSLRFKRIPLLPLRGSGILAAAVVAGLSLPTGHVAASTLVSLPMGQDITYGGVSSPRTVQSTLNNPAAPAASGRRGFWTGLGAVSVSAEFGDVDNLIERAEDLEEALDKDDLTLAQAEELKAEFDAFLEELGRDGYVKLSAAAQLPFTPFGANLPGWGGAFSLEANAIGSARLRILDAPIEVVPTGGGDFELQSRTSAYVKGAYGAQLAVGYSAVALHRPDGQLYVGGRLNYYQMELSKGIIALEDTDDDEEDFGDAVRDDLDRNTAKRSVTSLDVGALWVARNYQVGGYLRNLNEPSMKYPTIGRNCDSLDSGIAQANCFTAASFSDRIALDETYQMKRQLTLEASTFTANRSLFAGFSYDVNATRDIVADEHQWWSVHAGYASQSWWIPGVRAGYRSNQKGSELSYYTLGLTLFRVLNLDAAVSTDEVEVDGDKVPRAAMASLSLELYF